MGVPALPTLRTSRSARWATSTNELMSDGAPLACRDCMLFGTRLTARVRQAVHGQRTRPCRDVDIREDI